MDSKIFSGHAEVFYAINTPMSNYHVAAFYKFINLTDVHAHCARLHAQGDLAQLCGTILVAPEGINATVAVSDLGLLQTFIGYITATYDLDPDLVKWSTAASKPFQRFKVRPKKEIITMHRGDVDVAARTGTEILPQDWNDLIAQPDVLLVDTRNTYEVEIGTFKGAQTPPLNTFTDFADYVDRELDPAKTPKVAMFCTGGIRCEKASSYMLQKGFAEVYQLKGGILKYLEQVPEKDSQWQGTCFVFDERVALGHGLVVDDPHR
jgi:UPF0176 protein